MNGRTMARGPAILLVIAGLPGASALAGPLSPPAGPVGGTHRTLTEVEPRTAVSAANTPGDASSSFKISQPGSYYLTGPLTGEAGKMVIMVAAPDVTLDLQGFTISGGTSGIGHVMGYPNVTVRNGTVAGCTGAGIDLLHSEGATIEQVTVRGAGVAGILLADNAHLRDVRIDACQQHGIWAGGGAIMQRCTVSNCGGTGFEVFHGSRVTDCIARNNTGRGFFANGEDCVFTGCTARSSQGDGFYATSNCRFENCIASNSGAEGFCGRYNTVIIGCMSHDNTLRGIRVLDNSTVRSCQVRGNGSTGYAGIWLEGGGSRAEDNEMTYNGFGLWTTATDNVIVRNTARGNTGGNFAVAAGNELAPIVTNPGSNNFSTMTPWSNIAY